jgi:hypothetical protein
VSGLDDVVYGRVAGRFALAPLGRWGYARHLRTGATPHRAYQAMRKLYGSADPAPFEQLVARAGDEHPLLALGDDPPGVVHGVGPDLVAALDRDGFVVLPDRLDEPSCADLEAVATRATATLVGATGPTRRARFDPAAPPAVRFDLDEQDVLASAAAQRLLADRSLLAVAQAYLGAAPIVDLVAMWWSAAVGGGASDAAAQAFHFDLDRLRFLKLFVYLTDVDERHGPHVYVRGSHREKPPSLRRDGRHRDGAVQAAFPGAQARITGGRGTMFLADTLGLHKGEALEEGHRLVFQVEWCTSLFGAPFLRPSVSPVAPELGSAAREHPWAYQRFDLRAGVATAQESTGGTD